MRAVVEGVRAGVVVGAVLALWSAAAVWGEVEGLGASYVMAAYGLLGVWQVLYGAALGVVVAIALDVCRRMSVWPPGEALKREEVDRRVAAGLLSAPVMLAMIGGGVLGTHLVVTSKMVRVSFQALGLGLVSAGLAAGALVVAPLVYGGILWVVQRLGMGGMWTRLVAGVYGVGAVGALVVGYRWAAGLSVWDSATLQMGVAGVVLVPAVMWAMAKVSPASPVWRWGVPAVGAVLAVVCAALAPGWAVSSAAMRQATLRDAPLVSMIAPRLVDVGSQGGEAFAFEDCEEGEECADEGAQIALTSAEHPARRAVQLAVAAGDKAQIDRFEAIPEPPKNLVMILVDTLRQDHMGYAGYERPTTPRIDALAEDATVFLNAYATSPHTPRSVPPLLFSNYASEMKWWGAQYNYPRVRPENVGMFEVLEAGGWRNQAFSSHFYFDERRNVHQGFERWDNEGALSIAESNDDIAAPRTWERLEPVIEQLGRERREKGDEAEPFSLFVHFFEPHARWIGHKEYDFGRGETTRERHINNYDSEIAFTDAYVGRVIDKLKEEGLYDEVVIVLTSDHGEAFNEHGHYFHGQTLYNPVIKVPLLVRVPGWFGRQVEGPVSIIDVAPTVVDLFGLTIPTEFGGRSMTDVMLGRAEVPERPVFSELLPYTNWKEHHRAVVLGNEKLIVNFTLGLEEYFDLSVDPGEQNNLAAQRPERVKALRALLEARMQ
ncbi:sulfatase-like hydrolase/transferase [Lujinxingia vulgaris]|uniref:Sulfatase-like hydrolase/transferase n=1 Tax=Lujinxingia vulgaris TaxID=2600176 RepID=A0A5C6WVZ7_9DELT|nr:sulfatase-like hydrolase/transferase [Lujinxingia vulgaris]TXD31993.1 sulfatase-like hydrolase/transferase [Lujinxingia vulgaris]